MDDAVAGVRVQPVVTLLGAVERPERGLLGDRADQPDRRRERARLAVDVHLKVRVDVVDELLDRRALDPVDGGALGGGRGRREAEAGLEGIASGPAALAAAAGSRSRLVVCSPR